MIRNFDELEKLAKGRPPKRIALAMAQEDDALGAIVRAAEKGLAIPVLVGEEKKIREISAREGLNIKPYKILPAEGEASAAAKAVEAVRAGEADLLMKGKVSTATLMKAVLSKETGLRGAEVLSHVTLFEAPSYGKLLLMSDAALNIAPDLCTKAAIIANAVEVARRLGIERPKVAVLCAVEKVTPESMPATVEAALLAKMAERGQIKGCTVDGPLALDNAVSKKSCEIKGISSEVGGEADIVIVPDIEAGNIFYKAIAYLTDYRIAGIIVGAQVPIILTSRSDSDTVKYLSILSGVSLV